MRALIDQLDSRRAQVYIESLIVEVSGENAADFGFQWQGVIGKDGDKNIGVIGTNLPARARRSIIDITAGAIRDSTVTVGAGLNIGLIAHLIAAEPDALSMTVVMVAILALTSVLSGAFLSGG